MDSVRNTKLLERLIKFYNEMTTKFQFLQKEIDTNKNLINSNKKPVNKDEIIDIVSNMDYIKFFSEELNSVKNQVQKIGITLSEQNKKVNEYENKIELNKAEIENLAVSKIELENKLINTNNLVTTN